MARSAGGATGQVVLFQRRLWLVADDRGTAGGGLVRNCLARYRVDRFRLCSRHRRITGSVRLSD